MTFTFVRFSRFSEPLVVALALFSAPGCAVSPTDGEGGGAGIATGGTSGEGGTTGGNAGASPAGNGGTPGGAAGTPASGGSGGSGASGGAGSSGRAAGDTGGALVGGAGGQSGGAGLAGLGGVGAGGLAGESGAGGAAGAVSGGAAGVSSGGAAGAPLDPALLGKCNGTNPIICAIDVANGNHTVTIELGDSATVARSRVQTELYRISVPETQTAAGAFFRQTFSVNVREERHDGYSAPGGKLDLRIDGASPRLHGLAVVPAPTAITIFVAGDSTVCDWDPVAPNISSPDQRGWAQALSQYFEAGVAVANYADSGETAGGFYNKFWPGRGPIQAGDYVFVQFGHNDQKNATDIANYKTNLRKYIADARAKNATPVLFTPVGRKNATIAAPGFAGLDQQARDLAREDGVALVDLTTLSINFWRSQSNVNQFFANGGSDGTHLSEVGATQVSNLVAQAIKAGTLPLKDYVR